MKAGCNVTVDTQV